MTRKLYNPFKPHIVEFDNGTFAVRRSRVLYWEYYDNQKIRPSTYWWTNLTEGNEKYYLLDTLELAQTLLEMHYLRKVIKSNKVRKIYP